MTSYRDPMDFEGMHWRAETNEARQNRAEEIAELIDGVDDFNARVWIHGSNVRVCVRRELSRGRSEDCGDIEIAGDGSIEARITRSRGLIMALIGC